MKHKLILGCIADDFTGASDAASFLAAGGMSTVLLSGVPGAAFRLPEGTEAAVIALKSRTQPLPGAVEDSLAAIRWLQAQGADHFYVKYCSTFDSTPKGNIGPILDAVVEYLDAPASILCPALPANGRVVRGGILYVKGVPLAESPMKDHPLTPMWASRITELMAPQSRYPAAELHADLLRTGPDAVSAAVAAFSQGKPHCYFVPDYETDADAQLLADCFGSWKVLSGGSGILEALARKLRRCENPVTPDPRVPGPALILAGSCSTATTAQREYYGNQGGPTLRLEDDLLLSGAQTPAALWQQAKQLDTPLIYAYETPEGLMHKRDAAGKALSALIENTLSEIAFLAVQDGVTRIIVAGGETSGAVTRRLGYSAFRIGPSICPGVPILIPLDAPHIRLILKSGNFGPPDFFNACLVLSNA